MLCRHLLMFLLSFYKVVCSCCNKELGYLDLYLCLFFWFWEADRTCCWSCFVIGRVFNSLCNLYLCLGTAIIWNKYLRLWFGLFTNFADFIWEVFMFCYSLNHLCMSIFQQASHNIPECVLIRIIDILWNNNDFVFSLSQIYANLFPAFYVETREVWVMLINITVAPLE